MQLNTLHQLQQIHMENKVTIFNPNAQLMHQYLKKIKIRNQTIDYDIASKRISTTVFLCIHDHYLELLKTKNA